MKKLLLSITALVITVAVFAQKKSNDVAKFTSETLDLGKILQDHPTTATFEVTNIGKEPLLIEQASPTCGCTISDYTKEPIAPGKTGFIKATYNAKNLNMFEKHLTVKFAGCEDIKSITIKGEVIKDEAAEAAKAAKQAAESARAEGEKAEKKVVVGENIEMEGAQVEEGVNKKEVAKDEAKAPVKTTSATKTTAPAKNSSPAKAPVKTTEVKKGN
jgi:hypothetical protein